MLPGTTVVSPWAAALKRIDVYLTADLLWAPLPRGTRRIQMFHGVAGKFQHDYDRPQSSMRRWHRLFFVNQRRLRNFITAGAIDPSSDAPRLVGMPKVDCLVDGSLQRDDILRELGLDPARPTILYAPTWSAASSLNTMGLELVERADRSLVERHRQAARSVARSTRVLLRRRGLGGVPHACVAARPWSARHRIPTSARTSRPPM